MNTSIYKDSFKKNPNMEQLAPKIFLYKNFISGDLLVKINKILEEHKNMSTLKSNLDWYNSRTSDVVPEIHEVWEKASELIYPDLSMHPQLCVLRSTVGQPGMFHHSDAPGEPHENCGPICGTCDISTKALISKDSWKTCCRLHYGLIVYFGDFEGGEIYYPNIDRNGKYVGNFNPLNEGNEFLVKPNNGDLIIHGSHGDYTHGTKPVTRGVRYAYSNFVLPSAVNPGTFFNYKTPEYQRQISLIKQNSKERWTNWVQPVNDYVWKEPEELLKDKKNGITSVRYREVDACGNVVTQI